jgi:hypothetical protein
MGTQIIEARNKVHKVEAQNKKTRKVGANNSAIKKKTLKGEQTIHRVTRNKGPCPPSVVRLQIL